MDVFCDVLALCQIHRCFGFRSHFGAHILCTICSFCGILLILLCQISFQLGFDHSHLRSVNNLDSLPFYDHAHRAGRLQQLFINQRRVCDRAAESCRAAVHGSDIVSSSHAHYNGCTPAVFTVFCLAAAFSLFRFSPAGIHISLRVELRLLVIVLTSRCFQIKFFNQKTEQNVIQKEIHNSCRNDAKPAGFRIALKHTENHQIQKTTGKCKAHCNVQNMRNHIGTSGQDHLNRKQHWCYKQERELNWLCNSGKHAGQRRT